MRQRGETKEKFHVSRWFGSLWGCQPSALVPAFALYWWGEKFFHEAIYKYTHSPPLCTTALISWCKLDDSACGGPTTACDNKTTTLVHLIIWLPWQTVNFFSSFCTNGNAAHGWPWITQQQRKMRKWVIVWTAFLFSFFLGFCWNCMKGFKSLYNKRQEPTIQWANFYFFFFTWLSLFIPVALQWTK